MMKPLLMLVSVFCLQTVTTFAQEETWITNANLVDPSTQTIKPGATVVMKGGRITAIHRKSAPAGVATIDAAGKYLMPGLTDAHVHFFQNGGLYTRPDIIDLRKVRPYEDEIKSIHAGLEQQLRRYVQNGITTVFDVGATRHLLNRKPEMAGWSVAPAVYMAGPIITTDGEPVYNGLQDDIPFIRASSPEEARKLVDEQIPLRPDLIKLSFFPNGKAAEAYLPIVTAVIGQAHRHGLRVAVHATSRATARLAAEAGADFLVHSVEDGEIDDAFVSLVKKKNIIVCPTLTLENGYLQTFAQSRRFTARELLNAEPFALGSTYDLKQFPDSALAGIYKAKAVEHAAKSAAMLDFSQKNLRKLVAAGVTIVSGSDAGNIGTLHAVSLLPELFAMRQSGMSNWQVLQATTIHPARILNRQDYTGNIAVGQVANMLLLEGNPAADLSQLERIRLVISNGRAIRPDTLLHPGPEALVQQQLNAYNTRNMEAFLAAYADDVELYDFPDKLVCRGKEQMRKVYHFFDLAQLLHCRIAKRIVEGNYVVDEELILDDRGRRRGTAIYHVQNGKISKVYFLE